MIKWIGLSLGVLVGVSHIAMIGMISQQNKKEGLPVVNIPEGDYGSFRADVTKDGYKISYKANDPKTAYITKDIKEKAGFLGLATNRTQTVEEYFMDGQTNQGGAVSNKRSWLAPYQEFTDSNPELSDKDLACIKAVGSAEGTGRLVGTSVGAAAAPTLSTIPFVGWVAAGWVAMFGGEQGAEIGGNMAEDMNKNC
tara:strand:- start:1315 stop:1902 length:588 start_codon:yes stop_codon:yes gene_type:complete